MPTTLLLAPPDFRPSYGSADPYLFKQNCLESPKSSKKAPLNQHTCILNPLPPSFSSLFQLKVNFLHNKPHFLYMLKAGKKLTCSKKLIEVLLTLKNKNSLVVNGNLFLYIFITWMNKSSAFLLRRITIIVLWWSYWFIN